MTDFLAWFSPDVMRLVAWALLHFLWQGLVLAAVFAGLMAIARTAATRYALAVSILILMVAAPAVTFLFLRQSVSIVHPVVTIFRTPTPALAAAKPIPAGSMQATPAAGISPDTFLWLVRIWIAGVIFFSLRTAGGMLVIERLQRRKAAPVAHRLLQTCLDLQSRMGIKRAIRFCQCNGLDVPAVIGWFRPIVLLPMTVLAGLSQAQLEAVIAHELAHIKRWDYFVNLFQIAAETVLFYHPAVWWVSRRIRLERENCCDDMAVQLCGNVLDYARALTYMEGGRTAPSLVMAASGSPLAARVLRLLGARKSGGNVLGTGLAIGVVCLAGGILISQAFVRVAHADLRQGPATILPAKISASPKVATPSSSAKPANETAVRPMILLAQLAPPAPPAVALPTPAAPPTPPTQATASDQAPGQGSYIESLKAVGLDNLSVDDLVAMKIQGVNADYVRQLHELGLMPGADDLIAMRIQRVTPEYIRDIRVLGLNPSADDLVAMQIQGVTPAYIKELSAAGISKLTADDYIAAKVQGITPEFVEKARQHGFHNLDLDQLLALKRAGIL